MPRFILFTISFSDHNTNYHEKKNSLISFLSSVFLSTHWKGMSHNIGLRLINIKTFQKIQKNNFNGSVYLVLTTSPDFLKSTSSKGGGRLPKSSKIYGPMKGLGIFFESFRRRGIFMNVATGINSTPDRAKV